MVWRFAATCVILMAISSRSDNSRVARPKVVSRGVIHYLQNLPGFVALHEGEKVGLVTYNIVDQSCEIVTLNSTSPSSRVGTALIDAVRDIAIRKEDKGMARKFSG